MTDESWTIGSLLAWTTEYLQKHGVDTPRLDAEVLLAEANGCQRIDLYTAYNDQADEKTRVAYRELVSRRAQGMPVAYLVGRREFYSHDFRVNTDVLIPRPETEFVLVELLDLVKQVNRGPLEIADVGTGSGILAVCTALHIPECRITAIDISTAALEVAQTNATSHGVQDRVEFVESDLLASVERDKQWDFIVSNPPYVSESEWKDLATDVRNYEPRLALVAGTTGTEVISKIIQQSPQHLRAGGWLIMEISPMILEPVKSLFTSTSGWNSIRIIEDLAHYPRVVAAQWRDQ